MQHLILRPGPQLVLRAFRPEPDDTDDRLNEADVTDRAHEFLFEPVTVHSGTALGDVFKLIEASPLLRKVYRQDFAHEVSADLERQVAEIGAGTAGLVSGDDIFEPLDRPGCDALFDDLGGRSTREIATAIRDIDDNENAAAWLESAFEGQVVVKPQFRDRTGREFRKAFRAAAR